MELFDWLAPETLEPDDVSLAVAGPWLALTLFLSSLSTPDVAMHLGVSSDVFSWQESREGAGCCAVRFGAHCPMGFDANSLKPLLAQWPTLAFAVAHRASRTELDLHWLQTDFTWSGGLDAHRDFSARWCQSWPAWHRIDERIFALPHNAKIGAVATGVLLDAAPGHFESSSLFLAIREPLDIVRMLAGFEPCDSLTWAVLAGFDGIPYRLAPCPWWPRAAGRWSTGNGAALLGSMVAQSDLSNLDCCLAARRTLSISRSGIFPRGIAEHAWLWDALNQSLLSLSGRSAWVLACHSAREAECRELGETLRWARSPLSRWFDAQSLAQLAFRQPDNARALILGCGADLCKYSIDELNALSLAAPEIGSLFTAQLLKELTPAGQNCGSGSTRL